MTTIHHTSYKTNYNVSTLHFSSTSKTATNVYQSRLSTRPQVSLARAVRMVRVALPEATKRFATRYSLPFTSLLRLLLVAGLAVLVRVRGPPLVQSVQLLSLSLLLGLSRPSLWYVLKLQRLQALITNTSKTTTSNPDSGPSPYSAVVGPPISSAPISVSAPYVMNNGTQPTGTGASTGFLTRPSASFTLKPSSGIAPSSGVASASGTTPSSGIALSSNVASPSGTAPSSSSSVWPAAMATVVMQAYI